MGSRGPSWPRNGTAQECCEYCSGWRPEGVESRGGDYARRITGGGGQDERPRGREMIWVVWFMLALECLVIAISLWLMWVMVSEASRAPADPTSPVEHPPERPPAHPLERPPEAND